MNRPGFYIFLFLFTGAYYTFVDVPHQEQYANLVKEVEVQRNKNVSGSSMLKKSADQLPAMPDAQEPAKVLGTMIRAARPLSIVSINSQGIREEMGLTFEDIEMTVRGRRKAILKFMNQLEEHQPEFGFPSWSLRWVRKEKKGIEIVLYVRLTYIRKEASSVEPSIDETKKKGAEEKMDMTKVIEYDLELDGSKKMWSREKTSVL